MFCVKLSFLFVEIRIQKVRSHSKVTQRKTHLQSSCQSRCISLTCTLCSHFGCSYPLGRLLGPYTARALSGGTFSCKTRCSHHMRTLHNASQWTCLHTPRKLKDWEQELLVSLLFASLSLSLLESHLEACNEV